MKCTGMVVHLDPIKVQRSRLQTKVKSHRAEFTGGKTYTAMYSCQKARQSHSQSKADLS